MRKKNNLFITFLSIIIVLDAVVWMIIITPLYHSIVFYFLDVGQGDSMLVAMPDDVQMIVDGGPPNGRAQSSLEKVLGLKDRYIDIVAVTHPQLDHYGGLIDIVKNFDVGVVVTSNVTSENVSWKEFEKVIAERKIPRIILATGDAITYGDTRIDILSPGFYDRIKDINDMSLVMKIWHDGMTALLTGDIGADIERKLAQLYDIDVDVLKVSHHGSKFSSDSTFLNAVTPAVSLIGVGKNSYGHPTPQTLNRLARVGSQIYRTDIDGAVKISMDKNNLVVATE
ncbi:MAG: MBL fold metallo-hydrolase [bacterium]|nr:MBL fold metallo-hydrolase [bacterium]